MIVPWRLRLLGFLSTSLAFHRFSNLSVVTGRRASKMAAAATKADKPFGTWESPITSKSITASTVKLDGIFLSPEDSELYWLEGRPQEGGRNVLCKFGKESSDGSKQIIDVSPKDSNIRTRVHEYGGGALVMGHSKDMIFYSEFASQRLCRLDANGTSTPITPEGSRFRFADGVYEKESKIVYCVREDHEKPAPKDVVNEIVAVDTTATVGENNMKVVASGNDFYAAPRVSPDGKKLAYITWNHPNMPWDATELRVVSLEKPSGDVASPSHELIAGADQDTSVLQPLWHPTTGDLYYISDQNGFYNIYRNGESEPVLSVECDFGGSAPGWRFGQQGFGFLPNGNLVAQYKKNGRGVLLVAKVEKEGAATGVVEYGMEDGLPMQFGGVSAVDDTRLIFVGGAPDTPLSIYEWDMKKKEPAKVLRCSSSVSVSSDVISIPKQIEFPTTLGTAYGYYYGPHNAAFTCTSEKAPPLLVKAHGGPTACTGTSFNAAIQFWTSRGFAVFDVDYGGSTGYGRDYRRRLQKSWGVVDIDDVCNGAKYLVEQGLADGNRLCIDGGSAGGYTTLGALAFRDVFKAGCSMYGIGDLTALAGDTHKFESRYLDGLVGPYPQEEALYKSRSPIESVESLSCPILLLQGDEDKVVPPNQAEMMHAALLRKGIPTCLKMYEGEQHGFRKAENIEDAIDSELAFYGRIFGIAIPGAKQLNIDNL